MVFGEAGPSSRVVSPHWTIRYTTGPVVITVVFSYCTSVAAISISNERIGSDTISLAQLYYIYSFNGRPLRAPKTGYPCGFWYVVREGGTSSVSQVDVCVTKMLWLAALRNVRVEENGISSKGCHSSFGTSILPRKANKKNTRSSLRNYGYPYGPCLLPGLTLQVLTKHFGHCDFSKSSGEVQLPKTTTACDGYSLWFTESFG